MRSDKRKDNQIRPITITRNYITHAEGSVLIAVGKTMLVCTATVEEKVPQWLKDQNKGWVTAEYGMLPRSTHTRLNREKGHSSGRSLEISRLIGRSLRSVIDLEKLGERTIWLDCDVIQADGGTRTAAINGSMIALADAVKYLRDNEKIKEGVLTDFVAAISVGIFGNRELVDLAYDEDSKADVDMNLVMTGSKGIVEIQGTAEREPFPREKLDRLLALGEKAIEEIVTLQREVLNADIASLFASSAVAAAGTGS
ncbi:MAG: ribonuclease PH [Candidatus Xenobiia bacterium LiM19]